jgi:large subunit ribosomal protein L10
MARDDKSAAVAEITEQFRSASAAVLTEYRGLTVSQVTALRRSLSGVATYSVVKNTLTRIAARDAGVEGLDELLVGPSAIAFVTGDPVEAAKGLKTFAKENPALVVKGGYMDGRVLNASEVAKLADLESREVLLAKMAGAMKAKMSQAAALFVAPLSQVARTVEALRVKAEADPSVIGGAGTPSPVEAAVAAVEEVVEDVVHAVEDAVESVVEAVEHALGRDDDEAADDAGAPESTEKDQSEG